MSPKIKRPTKYKGGYIGTKNCSFTGTYVDNPVITEELKDLARDLKRKYSKYELRQLAEEMLSGH